MPKRKPKEPPVTARKPRPKRVKIPLLKGRGGPGPRCPNTQTPYDLVFG